MLLNMIKKLTILFYLFIVSQNVFGQQAEIDSLKQILQNKLNINEKTVVLRKLSLLLVQNSEPDSTILYANKLYQLAKKNKIFNKQSDALRILSEAYLKTNNLEKAKEKAKLVINLNDSLDILEEYLLGINQLGRVYHRAQEYKKAINTYQKGLDKYLSKYPEYEKSNKKLDKRISLLLSNMAVAYKQLNQNDKALELFVKAAQLADKSGDITRKSQTYYNLGWLYMNTEQYKKSTIYFHKVLPDSNRLSLKMYIYFSYHALGIAYSRWHKYDSAYYYNTKALKYFRRIGDQLYEFDVLNNMSALFQRKNEPKKALKYADSALIIAQKLNHKTAINGALLSKINALIVLKKYTKADEILHLVAKDTINTKYISMSSKADIYNNLFEVNYAMGNYKPAISYLKRFKQINDSILTEQRDNKISEIENKYQNEKKEKENQLLKTKNLHQQIIIEKESKQKQLLGIGFFTSIFVISLFAFYYHRNQKQKELIEQLQRDLHHRIKNNLALISALIDELKDKADFNNFKEKLQELQNRIASINEIHQQLYQNTDVTNLNLKKYIAKLTENARQSFASEHIKISYEIDDNLKVYTDKTFHIGLIINEFLLNSFKHAFDSNQSGIIKIHLKQQKENLLLKLSDNGKGLPPDFDLNNLQSFGWEIIPLLIKKLKGHFKIINKNGLQVEIIIPNTHI